MAIITGLLLAFIAVVASIINWCYGSVKPKSNSIEAFAYEESSGAQDYERNRQTDYRNLAGQLPTTPAVF